MNAGAVVATVALENGNPGALGQAFGPMAWPPRPGAPQMFPDRRVVRVSEGTQTDIDFSIAAASAGTHWRSVAGETWLKCSLLATGNGKSQTLICHVDARALDAGTHRTFLSVRTAEGNLRTVPLEIEVQPAAAVTRAFQAEAADMTGGFETLHAPDAHGGSFVRTISAEHAKPLSFIFNLAEAGKFFILARAKATGPAAKIASQDSVTLQIDDGEIMTWDLFALSDGAWTWTRAVPKENITGEFPLAAGPHRVRIGGREPLVELDEIVVSNSPFAP